MEFIDLGYDHFNKKDIESEINIYEKLIELNILPIDTNWSLKGLNFIKNIFVNFSLIIAIFTIVLSSDLFSGENKNKTYKILLNQPISKNKIYFGKIIGGSIATIISILSPLIILFILLSIFKGSGYLEYPLKIMINGSYKIISIGSILLNSFILVSSLIIFTISITTFFSIIFDSISLSMITPIGIYFFLDSILFSTEKTNKLSNLFPITITKMSSIIYDYDFKYVKIDLRIVFLITLIYSILLFSIAAVYFNKYKRFRV